MPKRIFHGLLDLIAFTIFQPPIMSLVKSEC